MILSTYFGVSAGRLGEPLCEGVCEARSALSARGLDRPEGGGGETQAEQGSLGEYLIKMRMMRAIIR
jgi:hypothetical protein